MSAELQKQLDEMRERAETAEARLNSITGMERTRLAELKFKEGFDAGIEHQRKAAPTPKAKQYRAALKTLVTNVKPIEFGNAVNGHKCLTCVGWDVGPNGETPQVHTKDCAFAAALAKAEAVLK